MNEENFGGISFENNATETAERLNNHFAPSNTEQQNNVLATAGHLSSAPAKVESPIENECIIAGVRLTNIVNKLSPEYEEIASTAMTYALTGRTAEAMQLAQDLVDHNISNEVAWLVYAHAKEEWGDKALAKKGYEQAIAINPRFSVAYNDYALFLVEDDIQTAMTCFNKALEFDPKVDLYMANIARYMCSTDSYEAAIEKCKYFIDISEEKTYLQNVLGEIYVDLCAEYIVEVPDDAENPNTDSTPGFISFEDIQEVRKLCNIAKSLLTLEEFSESVKLADEYLRVCDLDCELSPCHKKFHVFFCAVGAFLFYTLITAGIGLPLAIFVAIITFKADKFPGYVYNYVWCIGSDDPLKYSSDSFYKNHDTLKAFADGAKEGWHSTDNQDYGIVAEIIGLIFSSQFWFLKARIQFYKRFIKQKKEEKKNAVGTVKVDNITTAK